MKPSSCEEHPNISIVNGSVDSSVYNETAAAAAPPPPPPHSACEAEQFDWVLEECHHLREQATAKFQKEDVVGARALCSKGLELISRLPPSVLENDERYGKMVAALYSSRGVTYFWENLLQPCVDDCDRSLHWNPNCRRTHIRKWMVLDAMGQDRAALACLEKGYGELLRSDALARMSMLTQKKESTAEASNVHESSLSSTDTN